MKKQILAYITATINQYDRAKQDAETCGAMNVINDLTDLESFVADLKEDVQSADNKEIIERYIKRILELEESCENMCEVEKTCKRELIS